jgi:hypothetical protein
VPRTIVLAATAVVALAAGAAGAGTSAPLPDRLRPTLVATSFEAYSYAGANAERLAWRFPEWWASRRVRQAAFVGDLVERLGTTYYAPAAGFPGRIERRTYAARPDGHSQSELLGASGEFLLAKARAGRPSLRAARVGGRLALRGTERLRANDCAGLAAGTISVWLDRRTLLPLRTLEIRGSRRFVGQYSYNRIGRALPNRDFAAPRLRAGFERVDQGFRRTAPAHASGPLPYTPLLPARLPPGYRLAVSGWAPRGSRTGPEGSIAPHRQVFAAVYRRGLERIDVTQRLAAGRDWPDDPFGGECTFMFRERARVGARAAGYGAGPETTPHLYWRAGALLHTVSGPYPKSTLVAIAESLHPLGS